MYDHVLLLSVPGLRPHDLPHMPHLRQLVGAGEQAALVPSFPAVTWPVQANMLTGCLANEHGVVANGFYWREEQRVEMWTASNQVVQRPQIWDVLHQRSAELTSAVWFPMLSKDCGADYVCMPAPVHNPDGSETLWCYTKPSDLYGRLRGQLGDFPLQHFWGPLANIRSTAWITASAVAAFAEFRPRFCFLYLPHLDYAAQKAGPDSPSARLACVQLDELIGQLSSSVAELSGTGRVLWLIASEYAIVPVEHVLYPNRVLRESGLLVVRDGLNGQLGEQLDLQQSRAWAMVDHQFSHVFVREAQDIGVVVDLFGQQPGVSEVLAGDARRKYGLDHPRSGDVVLVSRADSWQAYYWWMDDSRAPSFARQVDIHRKPGYDPVELFFDPTTRGIPLDAGLVCGSHGAPATAAFQHGVLLSSAPGTLLGTAQFADRDVFEVVLRQFDT